MSDPGSPPAPESGAGAAHLNGAAPGDARVNADRLLDLFVFGPAELAMNTLRELGHFEEVAAKGRQRIGLQVSNARVIGQLVVTAGRRQFEHLIGGLASREDPAGTEPPLADAGDGAPSGRAHGAVGDGAEGDLAIPDYRALSASQVVRRLDGLGPEELEALYRYEATTRGRRTILHRAQQLLGREEPPVPSPLG